MLCSLVLLYKNPIRKKEDVRIPDRKQHSIQKKGDRCNPSTSPTNPKVPLRLGEKLGSGVLASSFICAQGFCGSVGTENIIY